MSYNDTLLRSLTRQKSLPFPAIADPILVLISEGIRSAWRMVLSSHGAGISSRPEKDLNASLVIELNNVVGSDPLLKGVINSVVRGSESIGVTGRQTELKPDINIYLHDRDSNFPLVGECKIINKPANKTINLYRTEGVNRFISGRYAWYNREGFMIGYVMDGTSVSTALSDRLGNPSGWPLGGCTHRCMTTHNRRFQYPDYVTGNRRPGDISLFHLWLEP